MAQSFAFDAGAPVQGQVDSGGAGYRPSSIVGGQAAGGDRSPASQGGADFGAQLGDYFGQLLKPALEREQRARFVKGMTDEMYAQAGHEIRTGSGVLSKIFGPTDYEQGAAFYDTQNRVAGAMQEWSSREDELKKLPKDKVAQEWAGLLNRTTTGDSYTDDLITQEMLKQASPMLQSVAKANYKYGQETVIKGQQTAWGNGAVAYQAQAQQFFDTQSPTDEQAQGFEVATQNFLQSFAPPQGQDEDSYFKSIATSFGDMIRNGNGHAATALMRRGLLNMLPEDQQLKLQDQYERFAARATSEASSQFVEDLNDLQGRLAFGEATGPEIVKAMTNYNEKIKRYTGFDADYFDTKDIRGGLSTIWSARKSALDKQEERAYQARRDNLSYQRQKDLEVFKSQQAAANAITAYNSANPALAVSSGAATSEALQGAIYKGYMNNDFVGMERSYKSGAVSKDAQNVIQNTISSSINTGYTKEFDGLFQKFNGMVHQNAALAKEYFGPQFAPMVNYQRLLTTQTPQVAFAMAFGDDVQYAVDTPAIANAKDKISKWVDNNVQSGRLYNMVTGSTNLNKSGALELRNLLARDVAQDGKFAGGNLSQDTLIRGAYERAITNGSFEKYGNLGWSNRPGTTPLYRLMNMQPQEAETIVHAVVDDRLKKSGFSKGADADEMTIVRGKYNGQQMLIVQPVDGDNGPDSSKTVVIPLSELTKAGQIYRRKQVEAPDFKKHNTLPNTGLSAMK